LLQKQFSARAYQTTFTTRLTVFFFPFQSSEANVQRDGVGANAMPGETDSLAQGADRQEQVSLLYSLLIQPEKKLLYENFFGCLRKADNSLTLNFFLLRRRLLDENSL